MSSTERSSEIDSQLAARLRLAIARLARRLRQQAEARISPSMLSALSSIERLGPCTLGDLATHERIQPPTLTRVVDRLEEDGLVAREPDDRDRRVTRVVLTSEGRQHIHRIRSRKNAYLAKKLRTLDSNELAVLESAVNVLERLLEEET